VKGKWWWRVRRTQQDRLAKDLDGAETLLRTSRWLAARSSRQQRSLVSALIGYAQRLADLGRHEEAVDALDEAISIGRRNVGDKPAEYETNLGMGLYLRAFFLVELQRLDEAITSISESSVIFRRLLPADPARLEPQLILALVNRQRVATESDLDAPNLGFALCILGGCLSVAERNDEALPIAEESVRIRRRLAQANPQKYESELAVSLRNLGIVLSRLNREAEACAATEEADVIDRRN